MLNKVKKVIPWWLKIAGKMVFSRMPATYRLWQFAGFFRHGHMDSAAYALNVFQSHLSKSGIDHEDLAGKTILEMGPGDSIATAIIAFGYGASAILIDSGPWARRDISPYHELVKVMREKGLRVPDLHSATSIDEVLESCRGRYITTGLKGWSAIGSGSVDFVFSQAVLEHVRKHEFEETQRQCWRVMAPSAVATHRIDLKDHLGGSLNNLRFRERAWESDFFTRSGFYTNRIQMAEMISLFEKAGFGVEILDVGRWPRLPTPRHKLAPEFANLPDMELCISGFEVRLKKMIENSSTDLLASRVEATK